MHPGRGSRIAGEKGGLAGSSDDRGWDAHLYRCNAPAGRSGTHHLRARAQFIQLGRGAMAMSALTRRKKI
jgi:hypothetical protein